MKLSQEAKDAAAMKYAYQIIQMLKPGYGVFVYRNILDGNLSVLVKERSD